MQFFEHTFVWDWCRTHGFPLVEDQPLVSPRLADDPTLIQHQRIVHSAAGLRDPAQRLASTAFGALDSWQSCLAWVTDYDVWENQEDWPRYYAWRAEYGERRSLAAAPGHLFTETEADALLWFLAHAIECGWDVTVLPVRGGKPTGIRLRTSHDEWIALHSVVPVNLVAPAG